MARRDGGPGSRRQRGAGGAPGRLTAWTERHVLALGTGVTALALALRLAHLRQVVAHDPYYAHLTVDPRVYHEWAQRLAAGDWLGQGVYFNSPLYPHVLGVLYRALGDSFLAGRALNAVLGAATVLLLVVLGRRLFGAVAGLVAGALLAVSPFAIFTGGDLLSETLQAFLNALLLLVLSAALARRSPALALVSGLVLGTSALARPNVLLFAPVAALFLLLPAWRDPTARRPALACAILLAAGTALAILPATLRNWMVGHDLVLVNAQGGVNLWIGNNPEATGRYHLPSLVPRAQADDPLEQAAVFRELAEESEGRRLEPSEVSRHWSREAWSWVAAAPGEWLRLEARKLVFLCSAQEVGEQRSFDMERGLSWVTRLRMPGWGTAFALAALGFVVTLPRWRETGFVHGFLLAMAVSLLLFFVTARYRLPFLPALLLLAGAGAAWLLARAESGEVPRAAAGTALVAAALALSTSGREPTAFAQNHYNLANKYRDLGRADEAIAEYRRAIELEPEYISSHNNLALLLAQEPARRDEAIAEWEEVLRLARSQRDAVRLARAQRWLDLLRTGAPLPTTPGTSP